MVANGFPIQRAPARHHRQAHVHEPRVLAPDGPKAVRPQIGQTRTASCPTWIPKLRRPIPKLALALVAGCTGGVGGGKINKELILVMSLIKLFQASTLVVIGAFWANPSHALILTFTNLTTFLNALNGATIFQDPFNNITSGSSPPLTRTGNGLNVTYSAPPGGLYNVTGGLSTNEATNNLLATLGSGIFAAGGNFYMTDVNGNVQSFPGQTISAFATNGIDPNSTLTATTNSTSNFFGWISTTPLTVVTSTSGGINPNRWNTIDNFIVATAPPTPVPGPPAFAGILGALAWSRRLRSRVAVGRSSQAH